MYDFLMKPDKILGKNKGEWGIINENRFDC